MPWWLPVVLGILLVAWMRVTQTGQQAWLATRVSIASTPQRLGPSFAVVVGIGSVVGAVVSLLGMGAGLEATFEQTGTDDTAIILRGGAQSEINSVIDHESATVISLSPQVLRNAQGQPVASPELVVVASLPRKNGGLEANVQVRGVGERAWDLHPNLKIIAGRRLIPGLRELVAGKTAHEQFSALDLGSTPRLNGQLWRVVGVFDAGNCHDSEIWGDTAVVGSAYRRGSDTNSITVRLKDTAAFAALKARLTSDPRLKVDVKTTRDYYRQQSQTLTRRVRILGVTVAVIMAIGATLGAINTIYAALATRTREIATLRAIGFEEVPLVMSILLETMLLALLGGTAGAAAAWALFDDFTAATLGENFGQVVFAFKLSPAVLWYGLQWALVIGFVGGLLPALRAARMPMS